jgi:hypothetical protein
MPLGEFDGDTLRPVDKDQLPRMEVHDLVAGVETMRPQLVTSSATGSTAKQMWSMPIL